jgi:carbamoyltransferase
MILLGVFSGYHDASACLADDYRLVAAVAQERLTRVKVDGGRVPDEAIDEALAIAGLTRRDVDMVVLGRGPFPWRHFRHWRGGRLIEGHVRQALGRAKMKSMERELVRQGHADALALFDAERFRADHGFRAATPVRFFNHHLAHALPALFHSDGDDALLYTADGGGDNVQYSRHVLRDGRLATIEGDDRAFARPMAVDSLGLAYGYVTQALGFRMNRHEGKVTGLAALGRPVVAEAIARRFRVEDDGRITTDYPSYLAMREHLAGLSRATAREDMAASIQHVLEETILAAVKRTLARHPAKHLGVAGGVFANVRLNQRLAEETNIEELFVYPAMSDAGLPHGGVLQALLERDGMTRWLDHRHRLDHLYLGRDHGDAAERALAATPGMRRVAIDTVAAVPDMLAAGRIVGLYTLGMEYGPRALGARSILAAPTDTTINDTLNRRLERSEFMPFAPVAADADADAVFDLPAALRYAARFMTVTCTVRPAWRTRVPAVVHVDGTARPQVIARAPNPLYFDILAGYKARTGIPVLINTSFNVHEEPIVNTPAEAARALLDGRIDALATAGGVWTREEAP